MFPNHDVIWVVGVDIDVPLRDECSKVIYSHHFSQVEISAFAVTLWKVELLCLTLRAALISKYNQIFSRKLDKMVHLTKQ